MDEFISAQVRCGAKMAHHVDAPTIEERSLIWASCGPLRAKNRLIGFLIFATIGLMIFAAAEKNILHTVMGIGGVLLISTLVYFSTISAFKREATDMLTRYNLSKKRNPSLGVDEFTKDEEIREYKRREDQSR